MANNKIVEIITQPFTMSIAKYKKTSKGINGTYIDRLRTKGQKLMQLLNYTIVVDKYTYSSENKLYFMFKKINKKASD